MGDPPSGPLPGALQRAIAPVAERLYRYGVGRRNARFDRGIGVVEIDRPVISIGNLSVGGTGKTPMVAWVVGELRAAGFEPCVAMRGYRAGATGGSDEAAEYARAIPDTPVIVGPNRVEGLIDHFATDAGARTDVVVLDDGFQHRRLGRQLDVVLIDASRDPFADRLLPAGWLREPLGALHRADAVVVTHAELVADRTLVEMERRLAHLTGRTVAGVCRHAWVELRVVHQGRERVEPVSWLRGRRVLGACGIGNPAGFFDAVEAAGAHVVDRWARRDHAAWGPSQARELARRGAAAGAVVVTEKDWVKLDAHEVAWPCPMVRPTLELRFDRGADVLRSIVLETARWTPDD